MMHHRPSRAPRNSTAQTILLVVCVLLGVELCSLSSDQPPVPVREVPCDPASVDTAERPVPEAVICALP